MRTQDKSAPQGHSSMILPGLHLGRLMSPEEVASATSERQSPVFASLRRWTLCGDISPNLFDVFRSRNLLPSAVERVTAFTAGSGVRYAVFSHQIGTFQHRFLLPLFEERVAKCLEEASRQPSLGYSLAGDGDEAIVWRSVLAPGHIAPLRQLVSSVGASQDEAVLAEYSRVIQEVSDPRRIPSVSPDQVVKRVSLTAVPPFELVSRIADRYGICT